MSINTPSGGEMIEEKPNKMLKSEEIKKEETPPASSIKEVNRCTAVAGLLQLHEKVNNQYKLYLKTKE